MSNKIEISHFWTSNCNRISKVSDVLKLFPNSDARGVVNWGWLLVSILCMGLAGYLLYPSLENLTEQAPAPQASVADTPQANEAPRAAPAPPRSQESESAPVETIGKVMIPAAPIHEEPPRIPEGIRNRIVGEIPVDLIIQIGKNGNVVSARSTGKGDSIQSYLAQQAIEAVRKWKFRPARIDDTAIPGEWAVRFRFRRSGAEWN